MKIIDLDTLKKMPDGTLYYPLYLATNCEPDRFGPLSTIVDDGRVLELAPFIDYNIGGKYPDNLIVTELGSWSMHDFYDEDDKFIVYDTEEIAELYKVISTSFGSALFGEFKVELYEGPPVGTIKLPEQF